MRSVAGVASLDHRALDVAQRDVEQHGRLECMIGPADAVGREHRATLSRLLCQSYALSQRIAGDTATRVSRLPLADAKSTV